MCSSCTNLPTSKISKFFAENSCSSWRQRNSRHCQSVLIRKMIFNTILVVFYATVVGAIDEVNKYTDIDSLNGCMVESDERVTSPINAGWPFQLDCQDQLEQLIDFYFFQGGQSTVNETDLQCVVTSGDSIVHVANITRPGQDIYSLYDASSIPYIVKNVSLTQNGTSFAAHLIGGERCFKMTYTLLVNEPKTQDSCAAATYENILNRDLVEGSIYLVPCVVDKNTFYLETESYEVTWYKNCNEIKRTVTSGRRLSGEYVIVDNLRITNANFSSAPGEYTCSVTYNGYERYLSKTNVCVKYAQHNGPPSFRPITSQKTKSPAGQDVTLTCGGLAGSISKISFALFWFKNSTNGTVERICTEYLMNIDEKKEDENKYQCNLYSNIDEASKCYSSYEESLRAKNRGVIRINSSLTIRNFQTSDEGQYICRVITTRAPVEVAFDLKLQKTNVLLIVLPTIIGFLFLFIICLALVVVIRRGCFQRHWKKKLEKSTAGVSNQEARQGIENASSQVSSTESLTKGKVLPQTVV